MGKPPEGSIRVSKGDIAAQKCQSAESHMHPESGSNAKVLFATHDTWGILDTGAKKTVIGSDSIKGFLGNLNPQTRKLVKRCKCEVDFRFGNQGNLKSQHALVFSVFGLAPFVQYVAANLGCHDGHWPK